LESVPSIFIVVPLAARSLSHTAM